MNFKKFLHDTLTGTNNYTTQEAAEYLELTYGQVLQLKKFGILRQVEGGGRGRRLYFAKENLDIVDDKLYKYR